MVGVHITVPIACFRMGYAREFWESHPLPPPSTCYGFLLSLVGEQDRNAHIGCRLTIAILATPDVSIVLRTMWRIKDKKKYPGVGNNKTPGHQQLLTGNELIVWLDSTDESHQNLNLEERVRQALDPRQRNHVSRFGGLSFGESTHLVDSVSILGERLQPKLTERQGRVFLKNSKSGQLNLPVWVDHVGSAGTRYVTGDLVEIPSLFEPPPLKEMPKIDPEEKQE